MRLLLLFTLSLFFLHAQKIPDTKQLLVVTTKNWSVSTGTLQRYESDGSNWKKVGNAIDIKLGRNGLGWGIGLHEVPQ